MITAVPVHEPRLARVAALIADPARSRMLAWLLDGASATAGELATAGGVTPATASGHLAKLLDAGLLTCQPRGRHRWFRLADAEVAQALQALALVAERGGHERTWRQPQRQRLREARCCYGHVAGRIGVGLLDAMRAHGALADVAEQADGFVLTAAGTAWLRGSLGFVATPAVGRQRFAYGCLDWSERRDHLAGSLARQLLEHFVANDWLRPGPPGDRALTPTAAGRRTLLPTIGLA